MLCGVSQAAFEVNLAGPRATSLGGAGVALSGDAWAGSRNPALVGVTPPSAGLVWSQLFGLPELSRESVVATSSLIGQPWYIETGSFGTDLYRESNIGLAFGRKLTETVSLGVEFRGDWLFIRDYARAGSFSITTGVLIEPHPNIAVGAVWRNLNEPRLSGYQDRIAESLTIGMVWQIRDEGDLVFDIVQESRHPAEYRLGAEARVLPTVALQVGARADPVRPSAGVQLDIRRFSFLYAGDLHPNLGASHELGLSFRIGQ